MYIVTFQRKLTRVLIFENLRQKKICQVSLRTEQAAEAANGAAFAEQV
jgi:hypothetical protein